MMLELPVLQYVRRLVLINIMYGFIITMMVWLPAKSIFYLLPGLLPYKMLLSHPMEFLALNLGLPLLQDELNLGTKLTHVSRVWMAGVSWIFGVTEYMMPPLPPTVPIVLAPNVAAAAAAAADAAAADDGDNGDDGNDGDDGDVGDDAEAPPPPAAADPPAAAAAAAAAGDTAPLKRSWFELRMGGLLVLSWLQIHLFIMALAVCPVILGRYAVSMVTATPTGEVYTFAVGMVMIRLTWKAVSGCWRWLQSAGGADIAAFFTSLTWVRNLAAKAYNLVAISIKLLIATFFCGVLLPLLLGVLLDLMIIIPLKVPEAMSPAYSLPQDWAVGMMALKLLQEAGLELAPRSWRDAALRVGENGVFKIELTPIFKLVNPVSAVLLTALAAPYAVVFGLLPQFGVNPRSTAVIFRWCYPACLLFVALQVLVHYMKTHTIDLYNGIRDDNYLVGETLLNNVDTRDGNAGAAGAGAGAGADGADGDDGASDDVEESDEEEEEEEEEDYDDDDDDDGDAEVDDTVTAADIVAAAAALAASGFTITGATGNSAHKINGTFSKTDEMQNGKPVYSKDGDADAWCYYEPNRMWYVTSTADKDANTNAGWACSLEAGFAAPQLVPVWQVFVNAEHFEVQPALKLANT